MCVCEERIYYYNIFDFCSTITNQRCIKLLRDDWALHILHSLKYSNNKNKIFNDKNILFFYFAIFLTSYTDLLRDTKIISRNSYWYFPFTYLFLHILIIEFLFMLLRFHLRARLYGSHEFLLQFLLWHVMHTYKSVSINTYLAAWLCRIPWSPRDRRLE